MFAELLGTIEDSACSAECEAVVMCAGFTRLDVSR